MISVAKESAGVDIRVSTASLAKGTIVIAYFALVASWTQSKTVEVQGEDLIFTVEHAAYKLHAGKEATIKCKYNQVDSPELKAPIVG
jgi:uncharacterized protein (DUF2141 family)